MIGSSFHAIPSAKTKMKGESFTATSHLLKSTFPRRSNSSFSSWVVQDSSSDAEGADPRGMRTRLRSSEGGCGIPHHMANRPQKSRE